MFLGPERERRAETARGPLLTKVNTGAQKCPTQWKRFLGSGENKASLISFLVREWQSAVYLDILGDKDLYVTEGERCFLLKASEAGMVRMEVPQLNSTQEEADTRMLLHAKHSANDGHKKVYHH